MKEENKGMSKEESKIEMALAKKDPFKAMGIV
jgi:hypothetical protein